MEDVIQTVGAGSGYALLSVALVLFWRLYRAVEKDRDWWRELAVSSLQLGKVATGTTETLAAPAIGTDEERRERLEAAARVLTGELAELGKKAIGG